MPKNFTYDVIIRHYMCESVAEFLASQLRKKGLRVWHEPPLRENAFPHAVALRNSRVMLLLLSDYLLDDSWLTLEEDSYFFRDPKDKEKKLIIIRINSAPLRPELQAYHNFDWNINSRDKIFPLILEACLPVYESGTQPKTLTGVRAMKKLLSFGHSGAIKSAAFSPNGKKLLTASTDHTLRLWESSSGFCLRVFQDDAVKYSTAAYNPDGHTIVSGSSNGKVTIWDVNTGKILHRLEGHTASVNSVAWSPDGRHVVSCSMDGTLRIWEGATCVRVLSANMDQVLNVAWSRDNRRLLSSSEDKNIRIWDVRKGDCLQVIEAGSAVDRLAYSPDGRMFLSLMANHTLEIFEAETGERMRILDGQLGPLYYLTEAAWSPDSRSLLLGSYFDTELHIWDIDAGRTIKMLSHWPSEMLCIAWSSDGRYVFMGGRDGRGNLQEIERGKQPLRLEGHNSSLCRAVLSPDEQLLLTGGSDETVRLWEMETGRCRTSSDGEHKGAVCAIAWKSDGSAVISGSGNGDLLLRNLKFHEPPSILKGTSAPQQVDWNPDGRYVLSASADINISLWQFPERTHIRDFSGHRDRVTTVKWSPDGHFVLSGSRDNTIRLWDVATGDCKAEWVGHAGEVQDVSWDLQGVYALSGSADRTVRVWEVQSGRCLQILEGHTSSVSTVAWSPDSRFMLSGSDDTTIRVWDFNISDCIYELKGHTERVVTVAFSKDGQSILATAANGVMRIWDVSILMSESRLHVLSTGKQMRYAIAKVMLCGDSGVGKTALANWLAGHKFTPTISTDGAWATQWNLPPVNALVNGVERQAWLWDFAGQQDIRLVHQLFLKGAAVAVLLFDPQKKDLIQGLEHWVNDLRKGDHESMSLLLAAGRVDRGRPVVSKSKIDKFMKEKGFRLPLHLTSALTEEGCEVLREAIIAAIDWGSIPVTNSPALFDRLKQEILHLRDNNITFISLSELQFRMQQALPEESFGLPELNTVIELLANPGIIRRLDIADLILLKPELLSRYASALIRKVWNYTEEMGYIEETDLMEGNLDYQDFQRLPEPEEKLILLTLNELLVRNAWCMRQVVGDKLLIVFPSYYRRDRPEQVQYPDTPYNFRFKGSAIDIYTTLIVRLHHTKTFKVDHLWNDAADFITSEGRIGLRLTRELNEDAVLDIWFEPIIDQGNRLIFLRYVYDHLISAKVNIISRSQIEEQFDSKEITHAVNLLEEKSQYELDEQSKEGQLVGLTWYITHSAGQYFRPVAFYDVGIDGEIEFRDDKGRATTKKLLLQLKSGDSFLKERKHDGAKVFQIKKQHHVDYWRDQSHPVMLIIRTSDGVIHWMDVRAYIRKAAKDGKGVLTQIIFKGEPFNVASIRRWREKLFSSHQDSV